MEAEQRAVMAALASMGLFWKSSAKLTEKEKQERTRPSAAGTD